MISLRQIEVLHAILSTGSVTVAAKALHVSQPAVSKMLQQAERQLGFKLFVRNGNRLSATEEALALYREIEKILPQVDAVQRLAENLRYGTGRTLRIVALPSLGQTLLPSALASFKPMHPALDIELRLQHTEELVRALLLRDADLGFDFGGMNHPAIVRKTLLISEYVCIAPAGWFPEGKVLTPDDFSKRPQIRMIRHNPPSHFIVENLPFTGFNKSSSTLSAQTYHAIMELVCKGLGVALVDPFTSIIGNDGNYTTHFIQPAPPLRLDCLSLRTRPISAMAQELATKLADVAEATLGRIDPKARVDAAK